MCFVNIFSHLCLVFSFSKHYFSKNEIFCFNKVYFIIFFPFFLNSVAAAAVAALDWHLHGWQALEPPYSSRSQSRTPADSRATAMFVPTESPFFLLWFMLSVLYLRNICLTHGCKYFLLCVLEILALGFTLGFMIDFELISAFGVRCDMNSN